MNKKETKETKQRRLVLVHQSDRPLPWPTYWCTVKGSFFVVFVIFLFKSPLLFARSSGKRQHAPVALGKFAHGELPHDNLLSVQAVTVNGKSFGQLLAGHV